MFNWFKSQRQRDDEWVKEEPTPPEISYLHMIDVYEGKTFIDKGVFKTHYLYFTNNRKTGMDNPFKLGSGMYVVTPFYFDRCKQELIKRGIISA